MASTDKGQAPLDADFEPTAGLLADADEGVTADAARGRVEGQRGQAGGGW